MHQPTVAVGPEPILELSGETDVAWAFEVLGPLLSAGRQMGARTTTTTTTTTTNNNNNNNNNI